MVVMKEFRIVMPMTLEEYHRGQRYSVARTSNEVTNGSEGIEVVENRLYEDERTGVEGVFTFKIYHLDSSVPSWIKAILPQSVMTLEEKAWDSFPHCKTVINNPFLGEKFSIVVESMHLLDRGEEENIFGLDDQTLNRRKVEHLDIAVDELCNKKYRSDSIDPKKVKFSKFDRGPLYLGWKEASEEPRMCCYKLVTIRCNIYGFQSRIENYMMEVEHDIILHFHKQLFCWMEDWFMLSTGEIVSMESNQFAEMEQKIQNKR